MASPKPSVMVNPGNAHTPQHSQKGHTLYYPATEIHSSATLGDRKNLPTNRVPSTPDSNSTIECSSTIQGPYFVGYEMIVPEPIYVDSLQHPVLKELEEYPKIGFNNYIRFYKKVIRKHLHNPASILTPEFGDHDIWECLREAAFAQQKDNLALFELFMSPIRGDVVRKRDARFVTFANFAERARALHGLAIEVESEFARDATDFLIGEWSF